MSGETGGRLTAEERAAKKLHAIADRMCARESVAPRELRGIADDLTRASVRADRDAALARVETLAEVVRRLQKPDPDTGDRHVSFLALVDALHPDSSPKPHTRFGCWCGIEHHHPDSSSEAHPFAHPHGAETVTGVSVGNAATGEVVGSVEFDRSDDDA